MLAVVAHFVTDSYVVEAPLLSSRALYGPHSGENQAQAFRNTLETYEIEADDVSCFVLDNAYNNQTCIRQLEKEFRWSKGEWKQCGVRCFGHIINLAAEAFLFGENNEHFEGSLQQKYKELKTDHTELWKLCGPIGKLHHIAVYIRKSPQRQNAFRELAVVFELDLQPICENATRWNSTYSMIQRAFKIRAAICLFCFNNKRKSPILRMTTACLKLKYLLTMIDLFCLMFNKVWSHLSVL
jgi:hypothetical protein